MSSADIQKSATV